jgi:hypothetical protein
MNETREISRRIMLEAHQIAAKLPAMLTSRKLTPAFSNFFLTSDGRMILFIAVLDSTRIGDHSRYVHPDLLHQLSTDLGGRKVYLSNSTGLRLVIPLSNPPKLPKSIELPEDVPTGGVALGVRLGGKSIFVPWNRLGHLLIAGMTGSGKSSLLRSIAIQAIHNDIQLALADIDQTTFSTLEGHALLYSPIATTPQQAFELIQKVLGECDHRATLYKAMPGFPENLDEYNTLAIKAGKDPLKRIILMLDESSSVLQAMGGSSGELAGTLAQLGWRGRKFGVNFVFGAQDISKELIGSIREQVNLSIAFRIKASSALMAKKIGCTNAHRIPANRPGLAIADRFGPMQSYYIPKPLLITAGASLGTGLSELEATLFTRAWGESEGKLTIVNIAEWGECSQHQARKMQSTWAMRGWIAKDGNRDNSFCLTAKALQLVTNHQTQQTSSNRRHTAHTPQ